MLKIHFVRPDYYDEVTRITHDKDKEHTNIYRLVCGKEECVASIPTGNITAIYSYDNNGDKSENMIDMWKGLVTFQEGESGFNDRQ